MFELHRGDCLDVMRKIKPASVAMVFADLPYGVTQNKWDTHIDLSAIWSLLAPIAVRGAAKIFTATQPFASVLVSSNLKKFRYDIVWEKANATGYLNSKRQPMRSHEHVLVFADAQTAYNPLRTSGHPPYAATTRIGASDNYGKHRRLSTGGSDTGERLPRSVLRVKCEARCNTHHPTQKPVALLEWLIATYTNPGDTVLDPVMGSGTTGHACANLGRRFIGIEKDPTYFAAAKARIESAYAAKSSDAMEMTA